MEASGLVLIELAIQKSSYLCCKAPTIFMNPLRGPDPLQATTMKTTTNLNIRTESTADFRPVEELTREAFWSVYLPG